MIILLSQPLEVTRPAIIIKNRTLSTESRRQAFAAIPGTNYKFEIWKLNYPFGKYYTTRTAKLTEVLILGILMLLSAFLIPTLYHLSDFC